MRTLVCDEFWLSRYCDIYLHCWMGNLKSGNNVLYTIKEVFHNSSKVRMYVECT